MCCVISSFITKPQQPRYTGHKVQSCVISSFITKPQPVANGGPNFAVALYLLSSPNHNPGTRELYAGFVALYLLSSPNHNRYSALDKKGKLRYIFFHHQTTTLPCTCRLALCCVISSFITKPQQLLATCIQVDGCVISSFITKPQHALKNAAETFGCVISSFITKPQLPRYTGHKIKSCVISSFITKPQPVFLMCCNIIQLQGVYSTGNGMVSSLSRAKLLKKLKLHRLLLYFLFYLSPYIDDVGVLLVGYCDYTKSSLAGHEEFYSLDVYIP